VTEDLALLADAEGFIEADFIVSLLDAYGIPYLVKRENPCGGARSPRHPPRMISLLSVRW
jgi:hypothetical protein